MKKIFLFVCAVILTLGLISCKKDKEETPSIIGTWKYTTWSSDVVTNKTGASAAIIETLPTLMNPMPRITFNSNGTGYNYANVPFTYVYLNGILTVVHTGYWNEVASVDLSARAMSLILDFAPAITEDAAAITSLKNDFGQDLIIQKVNVVFHYERE